MNKINRKSKIKGKNKIIVIAVTGTPGTGKSTLAKLLEKKLGFKRLDLHHCYKDISASYDRKKKCYNIDLIAFKKLVNKRINLLRREKKFKGLIIDTHISHLLPQKLIDLCFVLTCSNLKLLQKRLEKRKYSSAKVRENLDAEIFQICLVEAREKRHRIIVVDNYSNKIFPKLIHKIKKMLKISEITQKSSKQQFCS